METPLTNTPELTKPAAAQASVRAADDSILALLQIGVGELNMQTGVLTISPNFLKIIGYAPDEVGLRLSDWHPLLHPDDIPKIYSAIDEHCRNNTPFFLVEYRLRDKRGDYRWIAVRGKLVERTPAGAPLRIVGLFADISERKRAEQQSYAQADQLARNEKLASLGFLAAGIAHEINNPTQFIMANAPILEQAWQSIVPLLERYYRENGDFAVGGLDFSAARSTIPELFRGIREGAEHIRDIVAELREYVRATPNEIFEAVDMNAVVRAAEVLLKGRLNKATKHFQIHYCPDAPPVRGQFRRLEQVVINLIQNACDALRSPADAITVRVAASADRKWVWLSVTDTGAGIAPQDLPHVCDPFFTTKRDKGGTGLGLAISQTIMLQHSGRLALRSRPGCGTTAILVLPAGKAAG